MKPLITILILIFKLTYLAAQDNQTYTAWVKQFGGVETVLVSDIAIDKAGNIYITGSFQYIVDFNPGPGVYNLSSNGGSDIFILKLDASGNFVWAKAMGGPGSEWSSSIALDAAGNVYTTGRFQGTVDFDPGINAYNLTSYGYGDMFISKLDSSGNFIWAKQMTGSLNVGANGIAVDGLGNVYTAGYFYGMVDFDPGAANFNLTSNGNQDIFISKLDASGNFLWAKHLGGSRNALATDIVVDGSGNAYITGHFEGGFDFDPGPDTFHMSAFMYCKETFIVKLDAEGNFKWAKKLSAGNLEKRVIGQSITLDPNGVNVYTTGYFEGTIDFDPGTTKYYLTPIGYLDAFISKLDSSGNFIWAKQIGVDPYALAYSIAVDKFGGVYITGAFSGRIDFDPGSGIKYMESKGGTDMFLVKLNELGEFNWARQVSGSDNGSVNGISLELDSRGHIYTVGHFRNSISIDDDGNGFNLHAIGKLDGFVLKLSQGQQRLNEQNNFRCLSISIDQFHRSAVIRFWANMDGKALIRIVDISGRDVIEAFNQNVNAGNKYQVVFLGKNLLPGVYFAILQYEDGTMCAEKIVFVR